MKRTIAVALIPIAFLAACGNDPAPEAAEEGAGAVAEGDVLGGSISDDMLPLGTVESQSPPARRSSGGGSDDSDNEDGEG